MAENARSTMGKDVCAVIDKEMSPGRIQNHPVTRGDRAAIRAQWAQKIMAVQESRGAIRMWFGEGLHLGILPELTAMKRVSICKAYYSCLGGAVSLPSGYTD